MKTPVRLILLAALVASIAGCASEAELRKRDAERARREAQYDAEDRKRDRQDFEDYLEDYARDLGKSKSELTQAQRAEARREYNDRGASRFYRHHYWY